MSLVNQLEYCMTAEQFSVSFVNRLSLPKSQHSIATYYRSKLFITPFTTNPLVAAAGPLLSLLERLNITPTLPAIQNLRENIEHELRAFNSRLEGKAYTEELDAIAHFLLCASIDELIGKNYLRLYGKVAEFQAFTPSSYDGIGPERRFFDIVYYLKERPHQYLDLIELAYYCLITGFEGEQHGKTDGRQTLDNLIEELFQLIKLHRVNKSHQLFYHPKKIETSSKNRKPLFLTTLLLLICVCSCYLLSLTLIQNKAKQVQFGHVLMAKMDN